MVMDSTRAFTAADLTTAVITLSDLGDPIIRLSAQRDFQRSVKVLGLFAYNFPCEPVVIECDDKRFHRVYFAHG
jgi:hypothetical protein